jgi:hypothetical protein
MQEKMNDNKPQLVVREGVMQPQTFEIEQSVIENMILNATFAMPSVQVVISHKLAVVDAVLRLDDDAGHSISGFPRALVKQETRAMRKFATTSHDSSSKELSRTSSSTVGETDGRCSVRQQLNIQQNL